MRRPPGSWKFDDAELLEKSGRVRRRPVLGKLSVLNPVNCDRFDIELAAGRRNPEDFTLVPADASEPRHNLVALRNLIFDHVMARSCIPELVKGLLQTCATEGRPGNGGGS